MEIDDLQKAWAQYDKKLNENLKLNEQLLRTMNLDKSKKEMNLPFAHELVSLIVAGICMIFVISTTYKFAGNVELLLSGILTSIIIALAFIGAYKKIKILSNIDYHKASIIDLQRSLLKFDRLYLKCKKIEFILIPVFVLVALPILAMGSKGYDMLEHRDRYLAILISSIVLIYPIVIWGYKHAYSNKLRNANDFISELNEFELEE